jgi:3-oxoacyl-[acyl-carrier-protein] synthase II
LVLPGDSFKNRKCVEKVTGLAKRIGIFGWGVVAPKSPNIDEFKKNLASSETWLTPFNGFGRDNFLVGEPEFSFEDYRAWIDERFAPRHFRTLKEKMDYPSQFAVGAFIQSLNQNPGLEQEIHELGTKAHVYVGSGLGNLNTLYDASVKHHHAQAAWNAFWAGREQQLEIYLAELAEIESLSIEGDIEAGKLNAIREKEKRRLKLREKWNSPEPPWYVSANVIWNLHNTPAAQISILGRIHGLSFAPVAACSTFGVALHLAMNAIRTGEAKVVIVGATDPPPHPLTVGAFYSGRVLSADGHLSNPLARLHGTHVAGGSVIWIAGDLEYLSAKGFKPLGMEPLAVGVSSDAHHIVTPSAEGPRLAMNQALEDAGVTPDQIGTWDLHATATPGDYAEVANLRSIFPESILVTARKGMFGHGMGAGGGWELTAQYLGFSEGKLYPTPLAANELNPEIKNLHGAFVFDAGCPFPGKLAGKLSMGIGGINACVLSKPL